MSKVRARRADSYVRIFASMHTHPAVLTLPYPAHKLWFDLNTMWVGNNNGRLRITYSEMAKRGWTSHDTLDRARDELLHRGLIKRTKYCGPNVFHRASLFALTHLDVAACEPEGIAGSGATHDYRNWNGVLRSPGDGAERPRQTGSNRPARRGGADENRPAIRVTRNVAQPVDAKTQSTDSTAHAPVTRLPAIRNIITRGLGVVAVNPVVLDPAVPRAVPRSTDNEFDRAKLRWSRKQAAKAVKR